MAGYSNMRRSPCVPDPTLEVATQAIHGFVTVGDPMLVTRAEGHKILELDGKPA